VRVWWLLPAMVLSGLIWTGVMVVRGDTGRAPEGALSAALPGIIVPLARDGVPDVTVAEWPDVLTREQVADAARLAGWPEDLIPELLTVAWCESRFHRKVIGDHGRSFGLMQIQPQWHLGRIEALGYTVEDLLDPVVNLEVALDIYNDTGWSLWSCRP